jgi:hypothetical protein
MNRIMIFCACLCFASMCEGQILKDSLYWATPAERVMYNTAIKEGRGQKAVGLLIILGGSAIMTTGAGVAIAGLVRSGDDDCTYYDDELSTNRLLWKGGSILFLAGLGTIGIGVDKFKEGRQNVRSAKVCFKVNATGVGLVVNF